MHLLLISTGLGPSTGGTETQISRMSRWLIAHGHQVTLLANSVNELARPLPESFVAIDAGDRILDLSTPHRSSREWQGLGIDTPHVIKAFDLRASWIATLLADHIRPRPKVVFGNYYPYLIPASSNPLRDRSRRFFLLNLRRNFTDKSILCMTPEHVELFRRAYGATRNPIFWPLPVEDLSVGAPERAPVWGHIVSVGRLDPMKEYNLYMIEVVAELRRRGLPVTWTVYGEGTFMPRMVQRIAELGLGDAIRLAGPIDNSAVPAALRTAYVFVGMGTAIIEAALCRVPGVVALAYAQDEATYGPLYNFTFGNVGERMDDRPPDTTVTDELERILRLSPEQYDAEARRNVEYARRYEMNHTMARFLEIVEEASPPSAAKALRAVYYPYMVFDKLVLYAQALRRKATRHAH